MSFEEKSNELQIRATEIMNNGMALVDLFVNKNYLIDLDRCEPVALRALRNHSPIYLYLKSAKLFMTLMRTSMTNLLVYTVRFPILAVAHYLCCSAILTVLDSTWEQEIRSNPTSLKQFYKKVYAAISLVLKYANNLQRKWQGCLKDTFLMFIATWQYHLSQ